MILKTALILLYLVIGLWLFVSAVTYMGGKNSVYSDNVVFFVSLVLVVIFWPVFILHTFIRRR